MGPSKLVRGPLLPVIFLCFFYFVWSANLVRFTLQAVDYDPRNDGGLFHSESAFDYRYARMAAQGKSIPDFDPAAQWPEGLKTRQAIHTLMDKAAGEIYRRLIPSTVPFHFYIIHFVAYFSTLTVFPLFFLLRKLKTNPWLALGISAAYAMSFATYGRSLGGFLHENFTLPFLFLFLAGFYAAVEQPPSPEKFLSAKRWLGLTVAGLSLMVALASWHLSTFFFGAFALSLLLAALWQGLKLKQAEEANNLLTSFSLLIPFVLAAGLLFPTLRYQRFLLSPAMIFILFFFGAWWIHKIKSPARLALGGLLLAGAGAALFYSSRQGGEFSHVYDLLYYKLRFLGQKPSDPSLLSYDARIFWTAGFNTPTLKDLAWHYQLLLPLGLGGLVLYFIHNRKEKESPALLGLVLLTVIFLALSLLLLRMGVFLSFFLALFVPFWWKPPKKTSENTPKETAPGESPRLAFAGGRREKILKWAGALVLAAILAFQLFFAVSFKFDKQMRQENLLLSWINRHTLPQEPFLSTIELGSVILTYAERPVVLHSMFEEKGIREKNLKFLEALYGSEDDFYRYCRQTGTRYFLYQGFLLLDTSSDSNRYAAARMKLIPGAAAFRFHFQEKDLKHFQLVFQEGPFRLFKVKEATETKSPDILIIYSPFFSPALFEVEPASPIIENTQISRGFTKINDFQKQIELADDFLRKKLYNNALFNLASAEKIDPQSPVPPYLRANLYLAQKQPESAKKELEKALKKNPQYIYAQELRRRIP